jgi:signal transduction histidine kinase
MSVLSVLRRLTAPHPSITDVEQRRQSHLLAMLSVALFIGGIALLAGIIVNMTRLGDPFWWVLVITPIPACALLSIYLNQRGRYQPAALITVVLLLFTITAAWAVSARPTSLFYFVTALLISATLLNSKFTTWVSVFGIALLAVYMFVTPATITLPAHAPLIFLLFNALILFMYIRHRDLLEQERQQELKRINVQLQESEASLEVRVAGRTRELKIAADVSRKITTILDLDSLLKAIVERTKAGFRLYYVSIFLYDESTETLSFEAGAGMVEESTKAAGKPFSVPEDNNPVPMAARTRLPVIINNDQLEPHHQTNPCFCNARSELALPVVIGEVLIGVLDCQSEELNRFSAEDVSIMAVLADQIAVAVNNARLYAQQIHVTEKLREIDRVKSRFLASMSHELRTPLNAILNFTKFVSSGMLGPVNEKQVEVLDKAMMSGKHLLGLINDVLDITKIEAGMLNLFVEKNVSLANELEIVAVTGETLLQEKPTVRLVRAFTPDLPTVIGDKRRIRQILLNLVSNACKFTEQGSITIGAAVQGDHVTLTVEDTGHGIAPEDQAMIFEPFQQTEVGIKQGAGTGLGLPIARSLVEAHGGTMWVESIVETGSTFYVRLPIRSKTLEEKIILPVSNK